jgi:hypothetical protein
MRRSAQGVEVEVTADGLAAIRAGSRRLAPGNWCIFNAEPWFKHGGSYATDRTIGVGVSP